MNGTPLVEWGQFPAPAVEPPPAPGVMAQCLLVAAPAMGLAVAAEGPARGVAVGLAGAAAGALLARRVAAPRLAAMTAAVVTLVVLLSGLAAGRPSAISAGLGGLAWWVVVGRSREDVRVSAAALGPAAGISLLSGVLGWRTGSVVLTLFVQVVAIGAGVLLGAHPARAERIEATVQRVVRAIVRSIGRLLFALLGLLLVMLPWAVQRVVRWDPTWFRTRAGSAMIPVRPGLSDPRRTWTVDPSIERPGWRRAAHRLLASVGVVVSIVVLAALVLAPEAPPEPVAMRDAAWWPSGAAAQDATFDNARLTGFVGPVLADVRTEHTNVVDGRRRSWTPPVPARATVWVFGGSAAFGVGQRDERTIASELAKASWEAGTPIEVVNWGVHGDVHWMENRRLRAALTGGMEPPDLVVFYDGFNELNTVNYVNLQQRASGLTYVGSMDSTTLQRLDPVERFLLRFSAWGRATGLVEPAAGTSMSDEEVVDVAVRQYRSSVEETVAWLEAEGIPVLLVYQPSRATREQQVDGEGQDSADYVRMEQAFRSQLPDAVVDLSGAMDRVTSPVYWDAVHTNEAGAEQVASALHALVRDRLDDSGAGG